MVDTRACLILIHGFLTTTTREFRHQKPTAMKALEIETLSSIRRRSAPDRRDTLTFSEAICLLSRTLALTPPHRPLLVGWRSLLCAPPPKLLFLQGLHSFFHHRPYTLAKPSKACPVPPCGRFTPERCVVTVSSLAVGEEAVELLLSSAREWTNEPLPCV